MIGGFREGRALEKRGRSAWLSAFHRTDENEEMFAVVQKNARRIVKAKPRSRI
jgi:hypothetical protein